MSISPSTSTTSLTSLSSRYYYDLVKFPQADTIKIITFLLERITKTNDKIANNNSSNKRHQKDSNSPYALFYAKAVPVIDIHAYFTRILKYCPCTNECFLSLLVYLDRMSSNSNGLRIDSYNIHRLIITGIMVASKFFSDVFYTNARYAKVGGLPIKELNALELQFLKLNNFQLNVQVEELQQYGNKLLWHWVNQSTRLRKQQELHQHQLMSYNNTNTVATENNDTIPIAYNNNSTTTKEEHKQLRHHYRHHSMNSTTATCSSPALVTYTSPATHTPTSGIHSCSSNLMLFRHHHHEKSAVVPTKEFVDSVTTTI
ncbi:cyclin-domain-containing protein [Mycotypha africana]|uniref:cyclin-domain-containing protein n=1 Tax=Mycotypha africana TaxID=64632 RepID=UPI0023012B73|nr:cyclin-domain-containing protein [Mycotypha africana]KAI8991914.1 cyclin-domain-containing protein [Mycotypha africana]